MLEYIDFPLWKYPCERELYHSCPTDRMGKANAFGQLKEDVLSLVLLDLDFELKEHKLSENGADLVGYKNGNLAFAGEVFNESLFSYIDSSRAQSMVDNLNKYPGVPHFIFTNFGIMTEKARRIFEENNVSIITFGFQIIPQKMYDHEIKNDPSCSTFRERYSLRTLDIIRNKILTAFRKMGIEMPIYEICNGSTDIPIYEIWRQEFSMMMDIVQPIKYGEMEAPKHLSTCFPLESLKL